MNSYRSEEIEQIIAWFESHSDNLPATAHLAKGETIVDVSKFVARCINIARSQGQNATFARQIAYLFDLKAQIETAK